MADANAVDFSGMQRWYDQAGTPRLSVRMEYNAQEQLCTLHCSQRSPTTPESVEQKPLPIPLTLGLLLPDGSSLPLQLDGESQPQGLSRTLLVSEQNQIFTFINVVEKPLPSLLRGFSAPVELEYPYSRDDDVFLMRFDSDAFNRWAAAQRLAMQTLLAMLADNSEPDAVVADAFGCLLGDTELDAALKAEALSLPAEADIAEAFVTKTALPADPGCIHMVREQLRRKIAETLRDELNACYHSLSQAEGLDDAAMQQRQLKNSCLSLMVSLKDSAAITLAYRQFEKAGNMTDQYAALALLADCDCDERLKALEAFEQQWSSESGVMDKWFSVQAASTLPDTLERVKALMGHDKFDLHNPNKVRALIGTFAMRNPAAFHLADGSGYAFVADQVLLLDSLNPQIASRMVRALMSWKRVEPRRSVLMRSELQRIADSGGLSGDVYEIVSKSLC